MTEALQGLLWPDYVQGVVWITDWGGPLGWLLALQAVFYLLGVRQGVFIGLLATASLLTNAWLKWLFVAPRPYHVDPTLFVHQATGGFGMPSGHAQGAAAVWTGIARLASPGRALLAGALVLVLAVGASRVVLGVHSPAQVVVGWALGLASLWLAARMATPLGRWFESAGTGRIVAVAVGAALAAFGTTMLVLRLQAGFQVPALWQDNLIRVDPEATVLRPQELFSNLPALALIVAALGLVLVAWCQRRWPAQVARGADRWRVVLAGSVLSAASWWAIGASGWLLSPFALAVPLLYPIFCGYLPVRCVQVWRGR